MMIATNLRVHRGDTIKLQVTITRDDVAVNLTGATFRFTARRWLHSDSTVIAKDNSAFTVSSPSSGVAILTIAPADTVGITDQTDLFYDIEMTEADGRITTIAYGKMTILVDVSR